MFYSHSQLKTFDECALRFRYRYIDKIPEPATTPSPALKFGSIIHECLELLYKKIQNSGKPLTLIDLIAHFRSEMSKFRQEYDAVSELPFSSSDFDERISLGEQMLEWYYATYAPFDQAKINGLEQHIHFELPNTSQFRGVIDRLDIQGDQAYIVDYKTDKSIAPYGAFTDTYQQQLTSYAHRVMKQYPHVIKSVQGKLIYLRLEQEVIWEITADMLQQTIDKIVAKIAVIEETLFRYNMGEKDAFGPTEGYQCRRCAYQIMCPLWKHKFQDDEVVIISEIGETTIKKLVDKFYHLNTQKKELDDQLKGIKEFLEEYVQSHPEEEWKKLYGSQGQVDVRYNNDFDAKEDKKEELKQLLLAEGLLDLLTLQISTGKLTKYLSSHPEKMVEFTSFIEKKDKVMVGWAKEKK